MSLEESWSIVFSKKAGCSMPIGRVNARKPLGHSGHLRLQLVVGSIDTLKGYPLWRFVFVSLEM